MSVVALHRHEACHDRLLTHPSSAGSTSIRATRQTGTGQLRLTASGSSPERLDLGGPARIANSDPSRGDPGRVEGRGGRDAAAPAGERDARRRAPRRRSPVSPSGGLVGRELDVLAARALPLEPRADGRRWRRPPGTAPAARDAGCRRRRTTRATAGPSSPGAPRRPPGSTGRPSTPPISTETSAEPGPRRRRRPARRRPASGLDGDLGTGDEPGLDDGEGEAAQAVAARLGPAPVGVAELHADVAARHGRLARTKKAVGADAGVAVAERPGQARRAGPSAPSGDAPPATPLAGRLARRRLPRRAPRRRAR